MRQLQEAISKRDYDSAARLARENLRQIPALVKETRRRYRSFDIQSLPALESGGTMLALTGDEAGLAEMLQLVQSTKELAPWLETVKHHAQDRRMFREIARVIAQNPNCLQTEVAALIGADDRRNVAVLVSWLAKAGKITRKKQGRTYTLAIAGSIHTPGT